MFAAAEWSMEPWDPCPVAGIEKTAALRHPPLLPEDTCSFLGSFACVTPRERHLGLWFRGQPQPCMAYRKVETPCGFHLLEGQAGIWLLTFQQVEGVPGDS